MKHRGVPYDDWVKKLKKHNDIGRHLVNDLQFLVQGVKYHPELYVLHHSYLVVQALMRGGHTHLLEAGLFHDWGKIKTTFFHDGMKVTSYGHAEVSEELFSNIPQSYVSTDKEFTAWIIKRHMDFDVGHKRFKHPVKYDEPYSELEKFVKADKDDSRKDFFSSLEEDKSTVMIRHHKILRGVYDRERNPTTSATLYMNIGISGSGKSSHTKPFPTVSTDAIRQKMMGYVGFDPEIEDVVWDTAKDNVAFLLKDNRSVLFDATNVNRYNRVKFLSDVRYRVGKPFKTKGFLYTVYPAEARRRIEEDLTNGVDRSDVPMEVLNRQYKNLMESIKEGFTDLHEVQ